MQHHLFDPPSATPEARAEAAPAAPKKSRAQVLPCPPEPRWLELAASLPDALRLGTSSWSYPGWNGLVWHGRYSEALLSRQGLHAYGQHPLLRAVGIDRGFYRPLSASQYAHYAGQVADDFRFVVKAPSLVTDAQVRGEDGRGVQPNPAFLDPVLACQEFVQPALEGLGHKIGALVFQFSPLPSAHLQGPGLDQLLSRMRQMLGAAAELLGSAAPAALAIEVRDPALLTPDLVRMLRQARATYCLGLHAKMPTLEQQLPLLRALWPGPMVCRWNLNPVHGAYGYEDAAQHYSPYDRLQDPDLETRQLLARTAAAIARAGQPVYITISNKAEGCAPESVLALAQAIVSKP